MVPTLSPLIAFEMLPSLFRLNTTTAGREGKFIRLMVYNSEAVNVRTELRDDLSDFDIPGMLFSWHKVTAVMSITDSSFDVTS